MISYLKNWNHFWANKKKEMCEYDVLWSGIVRHALRNAVLPCMTLMATNLSGLVCGSFAIETIFSWNGIGKFAVESVKAKDLPVVEGYIVTVALTYIMKESYDTVKLLADSGPEFAGVLPAEANKDSFCRMRDIMHVKDCNGINPMLYCNYSCITC